MKETINLSINPSYFCNLRCSFCYLSDSQLGDKKKISPEALYSKLEEISLYRKIEHIDLYGGEIAFLDDAYLKEIISVMRLFYHDKINIISNLTKVHPLFLSEDVELSVSWDYFARERYEKAYENMQNLPRNFHILILASEKLIRMSDQDLAEFIRLLSQLPNLSSVEIKPFSANQFHSQNITHKDYELWVQKWIMRSNEFPFEFINEKKIIDSLESSYSAWSDDHLYITPEGHFSVLEFDSSNREYFLQVDSFLDYLNWANREKESVSSNIYCSQCKYLGRCLSEHLQPINNMDSSCNGFFNLLSWYENERL